MVAFLSFVLSMFVLNLVSLSCDDDDDDAWNSFR